MPAAAFGGADLADVPPDDLGRLIQTPRTMHDAATNLRFEEAARLATRSPELKRSCEPPSRSSRAPEHPFGDAAAGNIVLVADITIRGAREHNLRNVDLDLLRDKLISSPAC